MEGSALSDDYIPKRHNLDRRAASLITYGAAAGAPDDLLTTERVAEWLGTSAQFLEIGRHRGYGPIYVVLSDRIIRYLRRDVIAWLEQRRFAHTTAYRHRRPLRRPNAADTAE
jgi:hypothetical protein